MMFARVLLLAALCCSFGAPQAETPVLKIREEAVPRLEFERWLVAEHGEASARAFARGLLIHREAERAGLAVPVEESKARVDSLIDLRVETAFHGDREAWRRELEMGGSNELAHRALQMHRAGQDVELEALVRSKRLYGEPEQYKEWERIYGRNGVTLQVRLIAIDVEYAVRMPEQTPEKVNARREEAEAAALKEAEGIRQQVLKGHQFTGYVPYSDDKSRNRMGLLEPGLSGLKLPTNLVDELYDLEIGELTRPKVVDGRALLFQLESKSRTTFEAAQQAVLESLKNKPVSIEEIDSVLAPIEANEPLTVLPALDSPSGAPDEPLLRIGERVVTFEEFATWLRRRTGHVHTAGFVRSRLIEEMAVRENLTVTAEEIAQRVRDLIEVEAKFQFRGDQAKWEANLISRGKTREMYTQHAATRARQNLLVEKALLMDREFSEAELREAWEKKYGPNGRTLEARHILRFIRVPQMPEKATQEDVERLLEQAKEDARTFCVKLKGRIEDGEDFAALARQNSDDDVTRDDGGSTGGPFRERNWPSDILEAVGALKVGGITDPIFFSGGWLIFELVRDERVEFSTVREQLKIDLKSARPPAIEVAVFQEALLQQADWQILPAMYE